MDRAPLRGVVLNALILLYRYWSGLVSRSGRKGPCVLAPQTRNRPLSKRRKSLKADNSISMPRIRREDLFTVRLRKNATLELIE